MDKNKQMRMNISLAVVVALVVVGIIIFFAIQPATQETAAPVGGMVAAPDTMAEAGVAEDSLIISGAPGEIENDFAEGTVDTFPPQVEEDVFCDFAEWVGGPVPLDALEELGRPFRVLEPGAMATMDYLPQRINLNVDDDGIVTSVECG